MYSFGFSRISSMLAVSPAVATDSALSHLDFLLMKLARAWEKAYQGSFTRAPAILRLTVSAAATCPTGPKSSERPTTAANNGMKNNRDFLIVRPPFFNCLYSVNKKLPDKKPRTCYQGRWLLQRRTSPGGRVRKPSDYFCRCSFETYSTVIYAGLDSSPGGESVIITRTSLPPPIMGSGQALAAARQSIIALMVT